MLYRNLIEKIKLQQPTIRRRRSIIDSNSLSIVDSFSFRSIPLDASAIRRFCISRMSGLTSCLLLNLFHSFVFLYCGVVCQEIPLVYMLDYNRQKYRKIATRFKLSNSSASTNHHNMMMLRFNSWSFIITYIISFLPKIF